MKNATHKVSFWGVRCYLNDENGDLWGVNLFHELLIPVVTKFHQIMAMITEMFIIGYEDPGFRFRVLEEYNKE